MSQGVVETIAGESLVTFYYMHSRDHWTDMGTVRVERRVRAPPDTVWEAIADVEAVSEFAPNVSRAVALDPRGERMRRRCWDGRGNRWDETCVLWEPGRRYSFAVDTDGSENSIHRLFDRFLGTFEVSTRPDATVLAVEFELRPKYGPLGVVMFRAMRPRMCRVIARMVDEWATAIETQRTATTRRTGARSRHRTSNDQHSISKTTARPAFSKGRVNCRRLERFETLYLYSDSAGRGQS
ncbi:SRPBCC family protein [Haladaptatus sp. NG-WS-4]